METSGTDGSFLGSITDLAKYGIGRWIDQDTQRRVTINDASPYRLTADGRIVPAPGADVATFQTSLQNPWVLGLGIALLIGVGVFLAKR